MIQKIIFTFGLFVFSLSAAQPVAAFCGFYVAKADASLFNNASQVVLARHDNKTVITFEDGEQQKYGNGWEKEDENIKD